MSEVTLDDIDVAPGKIRVQSDPRWISIEERHPKAGSYVLGADKNGKLEVCHCYHVPDSDVVRFRICLDEYLFLALHWMPLPSPPEID